MFLTVRHWWGSGRGKVTARLFAFEFLVVVIGVLVAQALASFVQSAGEYSEMEDVREASREQMTVSAAVAEGWLKAAPCIEARMDGLMVRLSRGEPVDPALLQRPKLFTYLPFVPSDPVMTLVTRRYGRDEAFDIRSVATAHERSIEVLADVKSEWRELALVDPARGEVGPSDRDAARKAANAIRGDMESLEIAARNLLASTRRLGITPDGSAVLRPLRDCADLWASNATHPAPGS